MFFLKILLKSFKQRKSRIFLAVLAVVMGASLASALINIYLNINEKVGQELRSFGPNIVMGPKTNDIQSEVGGMDVGLPTDRNYINEKDLFKIKKIFWKYNILGFAPYLSVPVETDSSKDKVILTGTWFEKEVNVPGEEFKSVKTGVRPISPWWKVRGQWITNSDNQYDAMVGVRAAKKLNLKIGDILRVSLGSNAHQLKVVGIVDTGGSEDSQIFVNLPVVQNLAGLQDKVAQVKVSAMIVPEDSLSNKDPKQMTNKELEKWYCTPYVSSIVQQIKEAFPQADAEPIGQIAMAQGNMLAKIKLMVLLVTAIALLASAVGVTTVMTTNVMERRKEIGMIKAVGGENLQVAFLFVGEAASIGLVGGIIGFLGGTGLARVIGTSVFTTAINPQMIVFPITVIIALGVALLGSIIPVSRAISTNPVVVLRGE